jgi:hypothetical protein
MTVQLTTGEAEAAIEYTGNGWYRISNTYTATSNDTNDNHFIVFSNRTSQDNFDPYPNGNEDAYIWGAQVEQGSFPTSYIPTAGSQVTRAADNCSRALGQEYTSTGVTFFGEVVLEENYTLMRIFSCSSAAGGRNGMHLTSEGMGQFQAQVLGVPNTLLNGTVPFSKTTKYSYSVDPNGVLAFSINGSYFETPFISELSTLENVEINLGYYFENNNQYINSPISSLSMLPRAATEAEHIALTGGN